MNLKGFQSTCLCDPTSHPTFGKDNVICGSRVRILPGIKAWGCWECLVIGEAPVPVISHASSLVGV